MLLIHHFDKGIPRETTGWWRNARTRRAVLQTIQTFLNIFELFAHRGVYEHLACAGRVFWRLALGSFEKLDFVINYVVRRKFVSIIINHQLIIRAIGLFIYCRLRLLLEFDQTKQAWQKMQCCVSGSFP